MKAHRTLSGNIFANRCVQYLHLFASVTMFLLAIGGISAVAVAADEIYKLPPQRIVEIVDTPDTPASVMAPQGDMLMLIERQELISIADLAEPILRLAGIRFWPRRNSIQRKSFTRRVTVKSIKNGTETVLQMSAGMKGGWPKFSPNGRKIAISNVASEGIEVWVFDSANGIGRKVVDARTNGILLPVYGWERDSRHLLVPLVPADRGVAPVNPLAPAGPNILETRGVLAKNRTYQDLLQTAADEELFAYYARSQLARIDIESGETKPIGRPDWYVGVSPSPDGSQLLVERLDRPFSRSVPYDLFPRVFEIWNASDGTVLKTLWHRPLAIQLPIEGVVTGPRDFQWNQLASASLLWSEALDGGDPSATATFRDRLMILSAPFTGSPTPVIDLPQRYSNTIWLDRPGWMLVTDYDRDKRRRKTRLVELDNLKTASEAPLIFDLSVHDEYNFPGDPVHHSYPDGRTVAILASDTIFLSGYGATVDGYRPFLQRYSLSDNKKFELFRAATDTFEYFVDFADESRSKIVTTRESPTLPPNIFVRSLPAAGLSGERAGEPVAVTAFTDSIPEFGRIRKELLSYRRADGIPLSGTLYYPLDYASGTRVPVVVSAYPLEYTNASDAGQVRSVTNRYSRIGRDSFLFFVLHGYAVLENAEIPIVGDPLHANDTFVEQLKAGAQAAVDALVAKGVADRGRIGVVGHSYGAFMVANLLAHTDLFAAGIARSGAYNRTLTPFGFQGERRTYWEATDVYTKLSPFTHADKIKKPLLMIHGEVDDNSGTFPMQSERMFAAIGGHGGTARLVILPYEAHAYCARESVLHVLAESFDWFDHYVREQKP
ncbi:MAG: prolyl oligopeptidase family serine peptidase [Candidatus Riflebacteria bacterium]|nr:prolyl oligopeptidase family serine peptidase [Candidatus Riflebacteria bacterium]